MVNVVLRDFDPHVQGQTFSCNAFFNKKLRMQRVSKADLPRLSRLRRGAALFVVLVPNALIITHSKIKNIFSAGLILYHQAANIAAGRYFV